MAFLTEAEARAAGERASVLLRKTASSVIRESISGKDHFDLFLSHSILDQVVVLGAMRYLEDTGLSVYVDWEVDPQFGRSKVDCTTASVIRQRMQQCDSLLYLWSRNASQSKWMPWELGYFDALRGKVAVMPLLSQPGETFVGSEYVGLYPTVDLPRVAGKRVAVIDGIAARTWTKNVLEIKFSPSG